MAQTMTISPRPALKDRCVSFQTKPDLSRKAAYEVSISPAYAKFLLDMSKSSGFVNRKLSMRIVHRYANAMRNGEWVLSNDAILVTKNGKLINGQHRLMAVIESGTTQRFLIMTDADETMFKYLDGGVKRTLNDFMWASGLTDSTPAMAGASYYIINMFDRNEFFLKLHKSHVTYGYEEKVRTLLNKHYDLFLRAQVQQKRQSKNSFIPTKAFMVCYVLFSFADPDNAELFFDALYTKDWGSNKVLIATFNTLQRLPKNLNTESRNLQVMKVLFAGWNAYETNRTLSRLKTSVDNVLPHLEGFDAEKFFEGVFDGNPLWE